MTTDVAAAGTAALHRAVPYTRLVDYGMNPADARALLALTAQGRGWVDVASGLADARSAAAEAALVAGHRVTAVRAGRWAAGAAMCAQLAEGTDTPLKHVLYDRCSALVDRLTEPGAIERLELPYRGGHLVGRLCLPPSGTAAATVVVSGGLSGWGAAYLPVADALTARGLACLLAEGPGQGEPRLRHGLYLDEHVGEGFARFLDAVEADPRLGSAIGVQGNSFGGLFMAHLAARDPRVGACVVNGAPAVPVLPPFRTAREQMAAAIGTDDERRLSTVLDALRFDPARHRIACPVLVLHGGADPLVPDPAIQEPFAAGPRGELRIFPDGEHTLYNHAAERDALTADWFGDHLDPRRDDQPTTRPGADDVPHR